MIITSYQSKVMSQGGCGNPYVTVGYEEPLRT